MTSYRWYDGYDGYDAGGKMSRMTRRPQGALAFVLVALLTISAPAAASGWDSVTLLGDGFFAAGVTAALYPNHPELADRMLHTLLDTAVFTVGLKFTAGAPRPWEDDDPTWKPFSGQDSWPSGHTATAFAMAETFAEEYPRHKLAFYGAATLVGVSRVEVGMHHWEDVVAGAALGYVVARFGPVLKWEF